MPKGDGSKPKDIKGQRFGHLVALELVEQRVSGGRCWLMQCDCGRTKVIPLRSLHGGRSISCRKCDLVKRFYSHGQTAGGNTKLYRTWQSVKRRCINDPSYMGISICPEWANSFETFAAHLGEPPSKTHQIDRIDSAGNYEPGNVRWVLPVENNHNRRNIIWVEYNGELKPLKTWAKELGTRYVTAYNRYRRGLDPFEHLR